MMIIAMVLFTTNVMASEKTKAEWQELYAAAGCNCLLYTSPSPRDAHESRMPSSA